MNLGWLDVCLNVQDVRVSRSFYGRLGFRRVEGDDSEGWAVVVNAESRLGLFERRYMGEDRFSLNFRGCEVAEIAAVLREQGCHFERELCETAAGGASAALRDPDGNLLFFDRAAGEVKKS